MLKIYLTDLAAYNKGYLIGEWVTLPMDQEDIEVYITKVLKQGEALCFMQTQYYENHEEHYISDYQWDDISVFSINEYDDIYKLNKNLKTLEEHGKDDLDAIRFLLNENLASNIDDALTKLDDVIVHYDSTMESIAQDLLKECYDLEIIPSIIANNIDYESIARDLELEGNYYKNNGVIYEYIG